MSKDALIGFTGFVGGTLLRQRAFDAAFNSRNIDEIRGRQFRQVVCAGVSAVKWLANKEPEADWRGIQRLIDALATVNAEHFVLISTIDVYRDSMGLTELDAPPVEGLHPYGRHRLALELFVTERFSSHSIVRLPALFGPGLKKNAIFDLMTGNMTDKIVPNASFQWYPLRRLNSALTIITEVGVNLINITAEPVTMEDIRSRFFSAAEIGKPTVSAPRYEIRSQYDTLLGGSGGYHLDAASVFLELGAFLAERGA